MTNWNVMDFGAKADGVTNDAPAIPPMPATGRAADGFVYPQESISVAVF